jgi:glucose/arabinose dehydrogenase
MKKFTLTLLALLALAPFAEAQAKKKGADGKAVPSKKASAGPEAMALQDKYYERVQIPTPPGEVVEVSSIALLPGKKVAIASRRGDVWVCEGAYEADVTKVKWTKFASNLHEPLGMFYKGGSLYLTQRPEHTRLTDTDGDGKADVFDTICAKWGINGDYHEYAFGTDPDKDGNVWVVLCLTGSFHAYSPWRGWCVRITPEGKMIPTTSGIRSPGGIGMNEKSDVFYTDNQGVWNGSSSLKWLRPGSFQGNPTGNKSAQLANFPAPPEPKSGSRVLTERLQFPEFVPPAVVFPHGKVGNSPSGMACDMTKGKWGPWANQMFVGEQTASQVQRVNLEVVNGLYQGAVFHFLQGFEAGLVPVRMDQEDGTLFIGGTNRGWGSRGSQPFTFERVRYKGTVPFEMHNISARADGFEVTFTHPVDAATAADTASYSMNAFTYIYQSSYGSPEVDQAKPTVKSATVSADGLKVRLVIDGLVRGHVHHLVADGVRNKAGDALWHNEGWYTLNEIPSK